MGDNSGLPPFISQIVSAVVLGVLIFAAVFVATILMISS